MSQEQAKSELETKGAGKEEVIKKGEDESEKEGEKCESGEKAKDGQQPSEEHAKTTQQDAKSEDGDLAELVEIGKELIEAIGEIEKCWGDLKEEIRKAGGLSEIDFEQVLAEVIAEGHVFDSIDPETGRILDSIAGNVLFGMDGTDNSLGGTGKVILDNMVSGKFKRNVKPFVSAIPGLPSFEQDFHKERDRCLQNKVLFRDPQFPASHSSLFHSDKSDKEIEWLRPGEIVQKPQLIVEGHSRFDVNQGALGDCWFLAGLANLTLRDELFYRVVPPDQSFTENYAGIFHFQFWHYGVWVDVVIDDRLPTKEGKLIYMRSEKNNEFWSALLEKAYAKLYGSYEALEGGDTGEAFEDFTGGLTELYDMADLPKDRLLNMLMRGLQMGSMFGCAVARNPFTSQFQSNGLIQGHAYSINGLQTVKVPNGETIIIRVRNPWGDDSEWNGAWSDKAPEWKDVSDEQKVEMKVAHDGEFWMSFDDFVSEFTEVEVCNLGAEVMNEICEMTGIKGLPQKAWHSSTADGKWSRKKCGTVERDGEMESKTDFPQYGVRVKLEEDSLEKDGKCTLIASLMQKYRREQRKDGLGIINISFAVYPYDDLSEKVDRELLLKKEALVEKSVNHREATGRFRGPPGAYVIEVQSCDEEGTKSTYDEDVQAEYYLRVFATGAIELKELSAATCE